jgi:predicted SAM-dependent methyltransferase
MEKILNFLKRSEIKLEIGAGRRPGENGWITLDMNDCCDINWDLSYGIPFPDNSIDIIYSSHVFEHFYYNDIIKLLKECKRSLKPKGVFSISVPNAKMFIEAYIKNDFNFWDNLPLQYSPAYNKTNTLIDLVNYIAYMDGHHKYMFDEKNLINILIEVGFKNVKLREYEQYIDSAERKHESIYAIGIK